MSKECISSLIQVSNQAVGGNDILRDRRCFLALLAASAPICRSYAQSAPALANAKAPAEVITNERVHDFLVPDKHGSEPWRIFVLTPSCAVPSSGAPALYLLDGNATFPIAWYLLKTLESLNPDIFRGMVLVGIGYPKNVRIDVSRRTWDFTPGQQSGRNNFYEFITTELPAIIRTEAPIDASRQTLYGHSLGGLFAMYMACRDGGPFSRICAADPSYWFGEGLAIKEHENFIADRHRQASVSKAVLVEQSSELRSTTQKFTNILNEGDEPAHAKRFSPHTVARELAATRSMDIFYRRNTAVTHAGLMVASIDDALVFATGQTPVNSELVK